MRRNYIVLLVCFLLAGVIYFSSFIVIDGLGPQSALTIFGENINVPINNTNNNFILHAYFSIIINLILRNLQTLF